MAANKKKGFRIDARLIILLSVVLVFGAVIVIKGQKKIDKEPEIAAPVKVMKPKFGTLERSFRVSSYIESERMVTIVPRLGGILSTLNVDVGDAVTNGQPLAFVQNDSAQLQLNQAEAGYSAAKSSFERVKQLFEASATTKQNFDTAKAQFEATSNQYELAKLQIRYSTLESSIDGVVLVKHASQGAMVGQQSPVYTIGDIRHLLVKAKVPEKYYEVFQTHKGAMLLTLTRPETDRKPLRMKIRSVSPYISADTKNFEVVCDFLDRDPLLRPGMFVYMSFVLEERAGVYSLPFPVLVSKEELWYVEEPASVARKLKFTPGFFNDDWFMVPQEYRERYFITEGQYFLQEGQKVRMLKAGESE